MEAANQSQVALGVIGIQLAVIFAQLGLSILIAKKLGMRKRWGLIGFPMMAITAQIFRLISPALRFLEPLVTSIVQPMGQAGVILVFAVTTLVIVAISLGVVYGVLKLLKKKGFN